MTDKYKRIDKLIKLLVKYYHKATTNNLTGRESVIVSEAYRQAEELKNKR